MWVAARTHTIRIGHGVVCMPFNFNHPVRAAERAAMLDLLSGGRLDLGAGRGGTEQETSLCDGSAFVSTVVNDHFSELCPTIVLEDPEEARRTGIRGQRFFAQSIGHWYGGAGVPDEAVVAGADEEEGMRRAAEQVVARLHELDVPVRPAATATFNPQQACLETIRQWGEKVIPYFAGRGVRTGGHAPLPESGSKDAE